jgi:hypothetical protein
MTTIALLLAALMPTPQSGAAGADAVLAEMAPAPGRWEVEDAPAYFGKRTDIRDGPAPGEPATTAGQFTDTREGGALVAHRRP